VVETGYGEGGPAVGAGVWGGYGGAGEEVFAGVGEGGADGGGWEERCEVKGGAADLSGIVVLILVSPEWTPRCIYIEQNIVYPVGGYIGMLLLRPALRTSNPSKSPQLPHYSPLIIALLPLPLTPLPLPHHPLLQLLSPLSSFNLSHQLSPHPCTRMRPSKQRGRPLQSLPRLRPRLSRLPPRLLLRPQTPRQTLPAPQRERMRPSDSLLEFLQSGLLHVFCGGGLARAALGASEVSHGAECEGVVWAENELAAGEDGVRDFEGFGVERLGCDFSV